MVWLCPWLPPLFPHSWTLPEKIGATGLTCPTLPLLKSALDLSCHGREDSGQYWKGNPGEELWEKICQRVGPAASLQRSSTIFFSLLPYTQGDCVGAAGMLTRLLLSMFMLNKLLKRQEASIHRLLSEAVSDISSRVQRSLGWSLRQSELFSALSHSLMN